MQKNTCSTNRTKCPSRHLLHLPSGKMSRLFSGFITRWRSVYWNVICKQRGQCAGVFCSDFVDLWSSTTHLSIHRCGKVLLWRIKSNKSSQKLLIHTHFVFILGVFIWILPLCLQTVSQAFSHFRSCKPANHNGLERLLNGIWNIYLLHLGEILWQFCWV